MRALLLVLGLALSTAQAQTPRRAPLPPVGSETAERPAGAALWAPTGTVPGGWLYNATATPSGGIIAYVYHDRSGGGLYRSDDGGRTWAPGPAGVAASDWAVTTGPSGPVVCAAAQSVRCSSDDGRTFAAAMLAPAAFGLGAGRVSSLAADDAGALFALYSLDDPSVSSGAILRSRDAGATWARALDLPPFSQGASGRADIGAGPSVVFAAPTRTLRSDDGGDSWADAGPIYDAPYPAVSLEWTAAGALLMSSFAGGAWRSTDRGDSWTLGDAFVPSFSIYELAATPDGAVAAFTTAGVYRSTDDGRTFQQAGAGGGFWAFGGATLTGGATVAGGYDGVFQQAAPSTAFAPAEAGLDVFTVRRIVQTAGRLWALGVDRTYLSTNDGASWARVVGLPNWEVTDIVEAPDGTLLASATAFPLGRPDPGIFRSTDGGATWTKTLANRDVGGLIVLPDGSILAGASGGALRSGDGGLTWTATGAYPAGAPAALSRANGSLWAGTDYGIYRSTDDGASWTLVRGGLPTTQGADPVVFSRGVAAAGGVLVAAAGNGNGVYRSADGGATWARALDVGYAWDLIATADGAFWAATSRGAFQSTDGGTTWTDRSGGLPERAVYAVAEAADGRLLVGTGRGVFAAFGTVAAEAPPDLAATVRVFPSPARAGADLTIEAPGTARVVMSDALGRVVRRTQGEAGTVRLPTAGLAPGVYVVRVEAGGERATRRVVLVR